jgi:hypothetical protein
MNAVVVGAALALARVGWRAPRASLVIPAATLVNAAFLYLLPTALQGRAAPGVYSATLFYLPFSSWALVGAERDGVSRKDIAIAAAAGTALMLGVVAAARWLGP